jgi:hypothetical protein
MTTVSLTEQILVPTLMLCLLAGSLAGLVFGCALALKSGPTLQFIARMNRWVSTREAFRPLEAMHDVDPAPDSPYRRVLGVLFIAGGLVTVYFLMTRLDVAHAIDAKRAVVAALALQATKYFLVAGGLFALVIGLLMVFWPYQLAAFEVRMNRWYSARRLVAAEEVMHTPLEPRVEANPQAAGWIIAGASLLIALAMAWLLMSRVLAH